MFDSIMHFWHGFGAETKAALIGASGNIFVGGLGFCFVVKQIKISKSVELKTKLFEDTISLSSVLMDANIEFMNFIRFFDNAIILAISNVKANQAPYLPQARIPSLIEKRHKSASAAAEILCTLDRWQIVNPKIDIFNYALQSALYDVGQIFNKYFDFAMRFMPKDDPHESKPSWTPPSEADYREFKRISDGLIDEISTIESYRHDFVVEMQPLLLDGLFTNKAPRRQPLDPKFKVISLDRYDDLKRYFERQTPWGKHMTEVKTEVMSQI